LSPDPSHFDDSPERPAGPGLFGWGVRAYKLAVVLSFILAVGQVAIIRRAEPTLSIFVLVACLLPPIPAILYLLAPGVRPASRWLAFGFLTLIEFGIAIAPMPGILPGLRANRDMPAVVERMLTWYFYVLFCYGFLLIIPYFFTCKLIDHKKREKRRVSPLVWWLGLVTWGLYASILIPGITILTLIRLGWL
jgi:hypothetical protein